jgi:transcriptional regulator of acetoin/glycerol metabolism
MVVFQIAKGNSAFCFVDELQLQVDVRIIAATNRDLFRDVEQGKFSKDLYFRLNAFPIAVPLCYRLKRNQTVGLRYVACRIKASHIDKMPPYVYTYMYIQKGGSSLY